MLKKNRAACRLASLSRHVLLSPLTCEGAEPKPGMSTEERIQLIEDKQAISDILSRYAAGADGQNAEISMTVFKEDGRVLDVRNGTGSAQTGGPINLQSHGNYPKAAQLTMRNIMPIAFAGCITTQHWLGNHRYHSIEHDLKTGEGKAHVTVTMRAEHWCPEAGNALESGSERWTMFGYYDDYLERNPKTGEWRVSFVQLNCTRIEGDPRVMQVATEIGKKRMKEDPELAKQLQAGGKIAWQARKDDEGKRPVDLTKKTK